MNGYLSFPRKNDAAWVTTTFILSSFSFENYYGVPGLAHSVINDQYYEVSRKAYERQPINPADIPTDLHELVRAEYFDPQFFAASAFGRLVAETTSLSLDHQVAGPQLLWRERRSHQYRPAAVGDGLPASHRKRKRARRSRFHRTDDAPRDLRPRGAAVESVV